MQGGQNLGHFIHNDESRYPGNEMDFRTFANTKYLRLRPPSFAGMLMEDAGETEGNAFTLPGQVLKLWADNGSGTGGMVRNPPPTTCGVPTIFAICLDKVIP